jgi:hypothetical protein
LEIYDHNAHLDYVVHVFDELEIAVEKEMVEEVLRLVETYPCTDGDQEPDNPVNFDTQETVSTETESSETIEHPETEEEIPWVLIVMITAGVTILVVAGVVVLVIGRKS